MFKDQVARVAHEVNRAYCESQGDFSQPAWEDAPGWQIDSAMAGVNLHWDKDVGPEASHEAWMAHKLAEGWEYGPNKDPENKLHPCLVPFDQLPKEQQAKDFLFRAVVHALRRRNPALSAWLPRASTLTRVWGAAGMKPVEFVLWLNGAAELVGDQPPSPEQWATIREKLGEAVGGLVAARLLGRAEANPATTVRET